MQNEAKASRFRGLASPICIQTVGSLHTPNSGCTGVGPQPLKKKISSSWVWRAGPSQGSTGTVKRHTGGPLIKKPAPAAAPFYGQMPQEV